MRENGKLTGRNGDMQTVCNTDVDEASRSENWHQHESALIFFNVYLWLPKDFQSVGKQLSVSCCYPALDNNALKRTVLQVKCLP